MEASINTDSPNLHKILQIISMLPNEEQYFISDLLTRRMQELRRAELAAQGQAAQKKHAHGETSSGSAQDFLNVMYED